jgi:hypothetical protein
LSTAFVSPASGSEAERNKSGTEPPHSKPKLPLPFLCLFVFFVAILFPGEPGREKGAGRAKKGKLIRSS